MKLIAILIVLVLEYFLGHLQELRQPGWFLRYADEMRERFGSDWGGPATVALVLVPALTVVVLLQALLGTVLFGLPGFVFAIGVLVYCIGPRDLEGDVQSYLDAREVGDEARAQHLAEAFLSGAVPTDPAQRDRALLGGVLEQANERVFGVFFWFVLLGAAGAAVFRMAALLQEQNERHVGAGYQAAAGFFYELLAWIPARLLVLGYALSGSFDGAYHGWRRASESQHEGVPVSAPGTLIYSGFGALDLDADQPAGVEPADLANGLRLVRRALLIWLTVLALLTLAGWTG
ncbi:MAG: regulatory signaling modulator protein AmpE [Gammaproteobacteria bacterium]